MIYVRSDIRHRRRLDLEPVTQNSYDNEVLAIETQPSKAEKWFVVVFYKPPNVKDKHFATVFFSELCQALQRESSLWFIMVVSNFDMNADNLLCDLCVTYNLTNLVGGPTCFKGNNPSAADVLLSSEPKRFKGALNVICSLSDFHNVTCVASKLHKSYASPKTLFYRSYRKFDDETFINDVKYIPFSVCDIFDDHDDRLWNFN